MLSITELSGLYAKKYADQSFDREPRGLYEPMDHIMSIPGKHIRPLLLLLSCQAFGGQVEDGMGTAHAMELFHNFTLVHDDIMDAATLRRGIPTVHQRFGLSSGILAGDALFIYAYKYLCSIAPDRLPDILRIFNKTTIEVMEGQQLDMDFEQRLDVTIAEYLHMVGFKTSVLLACSLQIGAVVGGASAADQTALYDFGMKLGMSFQIKDDWLDSFGESNKVGKKPGGDIIQNKKTFLLITLLNDINEKDRHAMLTLMSENDEVKKVAGIKALYAQYQISEKTLNKVDALYKEALASLDSVSIPSKQKENLFIMADLVHKREF